MDSIGCYWNLPVVIESAGYSLNYYNLLENLNNYNESVGLYGIFVIFFTESIRFA